MREIARRLRAYYQKGLLDWYQGTVDETGLALMQAVAARCEKLCSGTPSVRLWWIAPASSRRFAMVDWKRVYLCDACWVAGSATENRFQRRQHGVGTRRTCGSGQESALLSGPLDVDRCASNIHREAYRLEDLFVGGEALERAQRILCGPDLESLKVVAAGIKEDLASVKTALDGHVRQGGSDPSISGRWRTSCAASPTRSDFSISVAAASWWRTTWSSCGASRGHLTS